MGMLDSAYYYYYCYFVGFIVVFVVVVVVNSVGYVCIQYISKAGNTCASMSVDKENIPHDCQLCCAFVSNYEHNEPRCPVATLISKLKASKMKLPQLKHEQN